MNYFASYVILMLKVMHYSVCSNIQGILSSNFCLSSLLVDIFSRFFFFSESSNFAHALLEKDLYIPFTIKGVLTSAMSRWALQRVKVEASIPIT